MIANKFQKVTSVNGSLQAAALQTVLEQAGVPVTLSISKGEAYLDVLVPVEMVSDVRSLLFPDGYGGYSSTLPVVL